MTAEGRSGEGVMEEANMQAELLQPQTEQPDISLSDDAFLDALCDVDWSVAFILIILATVFLSLRATLTQREQLVLSVCDPAAAAMVPSVFPIRATAGWMVIGALGFFFCLAFKTLSRAETEAEQISAGRNLAASALVLLAAAIRWADLWFTEQNRGSISEAELDRLDSQPE